MPFFVVRRASVVAAVIAGLLSPAAGPSPALGTEVVPDKPLTRDLVRRALLDACIYRLNGRAETDRMRMVDACQCAATRFMRDVKDADYAALTELPAAWIASVEETSGRCPK